MAGMTSKERFKRMYEHREADRVPIVDQPWAGTLRRWQGEGMPADVDWTDFFDIDKTEAVSCDNSPQYEAKVLEETEDYTIYTTVWGATQKSFKRADSTPEFLDFKVTTPKAWEDAKARMLAGEDRIDIKRVERNYARWISEGRWLTLHLWFGFDVAHSGMVGTETLLYAMYDEPEWVSDVFNTYLDVCLKHYDWLLNKGYVFDCVYWPDDMGYKGTTFFSNDMYRQLLKPVHKRAVDWAHARGMYVNLHSCGNVMSRVDDLIDIGIDALNPLEVKAGMQPKLLKQKYGGKLVLQGGVNAVYWDDKQRILAEIDDLLPVVMQNGGYIFSSDHSIPNTVSLDTFRTIVERVKQVGKY